MNINSGVFVFVGVFKYDIEYFRKQLKSKLYLENNYYKESREYFKSKYYPTWITSVFENLQSEGTPALLQLDITNTELSEIQLLEINDYERINVYRYRINEININRYREDLGIFSIKIELDGNYNFDDISYFCRNFRSINSTIAQNQKSSVTDIIEKYIISIFSPEINDWRYYNPNLKVAIFLDIDKKLDTLSQDKLLYRLGTLTMESEDLFEPSQRYFSDIMETNTIDLFNNWKVLCLYDTFVRIAINLGSLDKYKIWENEYLNIYLHVLHARYYLHHINSKLAKKEINLKESKTIRNNFISFMNDFELIKISYKYLPNVLFDKLKKILDVSSEKELIEIKISRINKDLQEEADNTLNRILYFLTLITIVSVAHDGGQLASTFIDADYRGFIHISTSVTLLVLISSIMLFFRFNKK